MINILNTLGEKMHNVHEHYGDYQHRELNTEILCQTEMLEIKDTGSRDKEQPNGYIRGINTPEERINKLKKLPKLKHKVKKGNRTENSETME